MHSHQLDSEAVLQSVSADWLGVKNKLDDLTGSFFQFPCSVMLVSIPPHIFGWMFQYACSVVKKRNMTTASPNHWPVRGSGRHKPFPIWRAPYFKDGVKFGHRKLQHLAKVYYTKSFHNNWKGDKENRKQKKQPSSEWIIIYYEVGQILFLIRTVS